MASGAVATHRLFAGPNQGIAVKRTGPATTPDALRHAADLARATGLSVAYCRQVKKGAVTPHPMWWGAMRTAIH